MYAGILTSPGIIFLNKEITTFEQINTNITNITNGDVVVKEAEHATNADNATNATNANHAKKKEKRLRIIIKLIIVGGRICQKLKK